MSSSSQLLSPSLSHSSLSSSSSSAFPPFSLPHVYSFSLPLIFSHFGLSDFHFLHCVTNNEIWKSSLNSLLSCQNYRFRHSYNWSVLDENIPDEKTPKDKNESTHHTNIENENKNAETIINTNILSPPCHPLFPFDHTFYPFIRHLTIGNNGLTQQQVLKNIRNIYKKLISIAQNTNSVRSSDPMILSSHLLSSSPSSASHYAFPLLRTLSFTFYIPSPDFDSDENYSLDINHLITETILGIVQFQLIRHGESGWEDVTTDDNEDIINDKGITHKGNGKGNNQSKTLSLLSHLMDFTKECQSPHKFHQRESNVSPSITFQHQSHPPSYRPLSLHLSVDFHFDHFPDSQPLDKEEFAKKCLETFLTHYDEVKSQCKMIDIEITLSLHPISSPLSISAAPTLIPHIDSLHCEVYDGMLEWPFPTLSTPSFSHLTKLQICKIQNLKFFATTLSTVCPMLHSLLFIPSFAIDLENWNDEEFQSLGWIIHSMKKTLRCVEIHFNPNAIVFFPSLFTHLIEDSYPHLTSFVIEMNENILSGAFSETLHVLNTSLIIRGAIDKYYTLFPSITSHFINGLQYFLLFRSPSVTLSHIKSITCSLSDNLYVDDLYRQGDRDNGRGNEDMDEHDIMVSMVFSKLYSFLSRITSSESLNYLSLHAVLSHSVFRRLCSAFSSSSGRLLKGFTFNVSPYPDESQRMESESKGNINEAEPTVMNTLSQSDHLTFLISFLSSSHCLHSLHLEVQKSLGEKKMLYSDNDMRLLRDSITFVTHPNLTSFTLSECQNISSLSYVSEFLLQCPQIKNLEISLKNPSLSIALAEALLNKKSPPDNSTGEGKSNVHEKKNIKHKIHHLNPKLEREYENEKHRILVEKEFLSSDTVTFPVSILNSVLKSIGEMKHLTSLELSMDAITLEKFASHIISSLSQNNIHLRTLKFLLFGPCHSYPQLLHPLIPLIDPSFSTINFHHLRIFDVILHDAKDERRTHAAYWPLECKEIRHRKGGKSRCKEKEMIQTTMQMVRERYFGARESGLELIEKLEKHLKEHK